MKTKTIKMIGYRVQGEVSVNLWGGGRGTLVMQPFEIYHPEFCEEDLEKVVPQGLNDNGFGVESFDYAWVTVYELYEEGVKEYAYDMEFDGTEVKFGCGFFDKGINARMV